MSFTRPEQQTLSRWPDEFRDAGWSSQQGSPYWEELHFNEEGSWKNCAPVLRRYPSQPDVFHLIISGKIWKKRISSQPVIQNWGDFREQTSQYLNQLTGTTSPDLIFKSLWYQVFSSLFGLKWQVSFKVPTLIRLNFIKRSEDKSWPVREPKYLSN